MPPAAPLGTKRWGGELFFGYCREGWREGGKGKHKSISEPEDFLQNLLAGVVVSDGSRASFDAGF